jgi:hypothetical protein
MLFNLFKGKRTKTFELHKSKLNEVKNVEASATRTYTGGKHWTKDEDNIIRSFYNLGISTEYISEALTKAGFERSPNAVQIRISRLNNNKTTRAKKTK